MDIPGRVSFTLWLCGCNLRCPFCHNWRIADARGDVCRRASIEEVLSALSGAARLVEYLHVTGGEPLLQVEPLTVLLKRVEALGLARSVDTNCTLPERLGRLRGLIEHLAVDLKPPWTTGVDPSWYHSRLLECLRVASGLGVTVELRVVVARGWEPSDYLRLYREAVEALRGAEHYVVVNELVGRPYTEPRDQEWCGEHCNPGRRLVEEVARLLREAGAPVKRVYARTV